MIIEVLLLVLRHVTVLPKIQAGGVIILCIDETITVSRLIDHDGCVNVELAAARQLSSDRTFLVGFEVSLILVTLDMHCHGSLNVGSISLIRISYGVDKLSRILELQGVNFKVRGRSENITFLMLLASSQGSCTYVYVFFISARRPLVLKTEPISSTSAVSESGYLALVSMSTDLYTRMIMAPFLWLWTMCFLGTASALEKDSKCDRILIFLTMITSHRDMAVIISSHPAGVLSCTGRSGRAIM
ncbi:hypothetical protein P692DRAFT_20821686 [Suillus brevipes Sb2]|nr:hypothetical protein P692DRAFT_20821686 [Suillus brevipes Sb2]